MIQPAPEFDVIKQLAEKAGIPLKEALAEVQGKNKEKVQGSE